MVSGVWPDFGETLPVFLPECGGSYLLRDTPRCGPTVDIFWINASFFKMMMITRAVATVDQKRQNCSVTWILLILEWAGRPALSVPSALPSSVGLCFCLVTFPRNESQGINLAATSPGSEAGVKTFRAGSQKAGPSFLSLAVHVKRPPPLAGPCTPLWLGTNLGFFQGVGIAHNKSTWRGF